MSTLYLIIHASINLIKNIQYFSVKVKIIIVSITQQHILEYNTVFISMKYWIWYGKYPINFHTSKEKSVT